MTPSSSRSRSSAAFERAKSFIPGAVNSPGRAFSEVDYPPLVIERGAGKYVFDLDGNRYLDFMCGLGPAVLGHSNAEVARAVSDQYTRGTVFGASTSVEYELAELIVGAGRCTESIRFTCSGTEATMTAARLAKAATGRRGVLKFKGGYHGHSDALLPGGTKRHMLPAPGARPVNGLDPGLEASTYTGVYNDAETVAEILRDHGDQVAAIIVEPVASNMGVVPPVEGFLSKLRQLADEHGCILIFDEVVSGFRHRFGPVADAFGVRPDLVCYGKIIGGGLPVGAYAGRKDLMGLLEQRGSVFQGGTFAGSALTMAAGLAQLKILQRDRVNEALETQGAFLQQALLERFREAGRPFGVQRHGSLVTPVLVPGKERLFNHADVELQDKNLFRTIHRTMLAKGILLPPTIEEPIFISALHTRDDLVALADAFVAGALVHQA
jgi:glutamate-1-semialdehyde 2,1-aminomutase